jgi:hypothetical protein
MSTSVLDHIDERNAHLSDRMRVVLRFEGDAIVNFGQALLLALPLALLAGDGIVVVIGVAYLLFYLAITLVPTAIFVLLIFDGVRLLLRRRPAFAVYFEAIGKNGMKHGLHKRVPFLLRVGVTGHPLGMFMREVWLLVERFNPQAIQEIDEASDAIVQRMAAPTTVEKLISQEVRPVRIQKVEALQLVEC